jgi:hypothetical protein
VSEFDDMASAGQTDALERNPKLIAVTALGAILIGGLLWFFFVAPLLVGDGEEVIGLPVAAATASTAESADGQGEEVEGDEVVDDLPLVTYEVFLDRDPFDPVVPEPVAATTATEGTGETADPDGTDPVDSADPGVTPVDGTDPDPTAPSPPTTGAPAPSPVCTSGEQQIECNGRTVSLIEIRTDDDGQLVAIIQVDTTIYEVREGDTFAGSFRVQSITDEGVLLQYGDDVEPLEVGDRVLK